MVSQVDTHNSYMCLAFRPLIRFDGTVGRVGVESGGIAMIDPECYPNLLMAAPAMYQGLAMLLSVLDRKTEEGQWACEAIEAIMSFAQNGYLGSTSIDDIIKRMKK